MIAKSEFIDIVNKLKEVNDFVDETNERAKKLNDAIISDFYDAMSLSISHENLVVKLLENIFDDNGIISWWLYELSYGRKYFDGCIQDENGKDIDLSNESKLYDYLVGEEGYVPCKNVNYSKVYEMPEK